MVDTLQRERLIEALIGTFKWLYAESTSLEMQKKKDIDSGVWYSVAMNNVIFFF